MWTSLALGVQRTGAGGRVGYRHARAGRIVTAGSAPMSREELVGAYVEGRLSRRVFIRSLVALGVTAAAAVTYADTLASAAPTVGAPDDIYPENPTSTTSTTAAVDPSVIGTGANSASQDPNQAAAAARVTPGFTG